MATGFTTRSKGKSSFASLWVGGSQVAGPGAALSYSTGGTQTIGTEGVSSIVASSGISVFSLAALPTPGVTKMLDLTVSSAVQIKAAAGSVFSGTTLSVIKSTYAMRVELVGLSSAAWAIMSVYPETTLGGAPVGGITLTTTT